MFFKFLMHCLNNFINYVLTQLKNYNPKPQIFSENIDGVDHIYEQITMKIINIKIFYEKKIIRNSSECAP